MSDPKNPAQNVMPVGGPNSDKNSSTLRSRAIAFLVFLVVAVGGMMAFVFVGMSNQLMTADLETRGRAAAASIAENAKLGLLVRDKKILREALSPYLIDPDIRYIDVIDGDGTTLFSLPENHSRIGDTIVIQETLDGQKLTIQHLSASKAADKVSYHIGAPVMRDMISDTNGDPFTDEGREAVPSESPRLIGMVRLGLSTARVQDQIDTLVSRAGLVAALLAVVGLLVASTLLRRWLSPLELLTDVARKIKRTGLEDALNEKALSEIAAANLRGRTGELATLQSAFLDMLEELKLHDRAQAEQKDRLEQMVVERTMELTFAKEEAEAANIAKSKFLASMSHELRTPLNAVIGFSEMLQQDIMVKPEQQQEYLGYIRDSGKHLLDIINDILDLSKLEAGRFELQIRDALLDDIVEGAVAISQPVIERKNLSCSVDCPPIQIRTDARILKQVIINLVSNAVKFTPADGSVSITATESGDTYCLTVTDTGIGMSDAEIEVALQPFSQVSDHMYVQQEEGSGTGLGLPLVEHFVLLMKGDMRIESEKGAGTRIYLTLPIHPEPPESSDPGNDFDYI
ncbi:sensor histidine kinase [Kordiimonas aestuarii]|uniref:sensor histidine kinase n=1 Tax=Kordiimonas aestuarii TaxID=1005925 RepID=UPI0021CED07A|nr:ATP-binding protein [Kordiimonas aestuarii]